MHCLKASLMHYRFPYVGTYLRHQPGIQRTLHDHRYGLVYHAICLFTLPAFAGYSFQSNNRGLQARAE